jgi:hypothetical protein
MKRRDASSTRTMRVCFIEGHRDLASIRAWGSSDQRGDREKEKWLNALLRKVRNDT